MTDTEELAKAAELLSLVQRAQILQKHGASYDRALRQRDRWDARWGTALASTWPKPTPEQIEAVTRVAERAWAAGEVEKVVRPDRVLRAVGSWFQSSFTSLFDFVRGALPIYLSLAADEGEEAGQHSLDQLGLNQTFRWTSVRDIPRDMFSVRGSKVLQQAYGTHINRLRDLIIDATNPARPKTHNEVVAQLRDEWPGVASRDIERIARTETAAVWNTASVNAFAANNVAWYDWSIASGPSIGPPKSYPVCKVCVAHGAGGPYPLQELPDLPAHPNCRCVIIPSLTRDWLPPAEPWSGNNPPLPIIEAPGV